MNEETLAGIIVGAILIAFVGFLFWFFPTYNVWQAGMSGKAKLAEANYSRMASVATSKAHYESALFNRKTKEVDALASSNAEKIKAEGIACANKKIQASITPQILQYKYISAIQNIKGNLYFTNGNSMPAVMLK